MYFEIYRKGNLIKRGDEILNDDLNWSNELMYVPQLTITIPITYHEYIYGRDELKVFVNNKCFWGIVSGITENKVEETIDVDLMHVVNEWTYRQISVNNAIKDQKVNIIFKGSKTVSDDGKNVSASPFNVLVNEVDTMTPEKYIKRAGASAWKDNGDKLSITSVDSSEVLAKTGSYDVEFKCGSISVTVTATVKNPDGAKTNTKNKVTLSASPFEMTVDEVKTFKAEDYIKRAMATAWTKT